MRPRRGLSSARPSSPRPGPRTVAASHTGVYVILDGRFDFLNEKAALLAGYSVNEMIGMRCTDIVHPGDCAAIRRQAIEMLNGIKTVQTQAIQLWFTPDSAELGVPQTIPVTGGYAEPYSSLTDFIGPTSTSSPM